MLAASLLQMSTFSQSLTPSRDVLGTEHPRRQRDFSSAKPQKEIRIKSLKDVDSPGQPKPSAGTRGENVKMIIRTRPDQCDDEDDANVKPCSSSVIRVWQRDETSLLRVQPAPLG